METEVKSFGTATCKHPISFEGVCIDCRATGIKSRVEICNSTKTKLNLDWDIFNKRENMSEEELIISLLAMKVEVRISGVKQSLRYGPDRNEPHTYLNLRTLLLLNNKNNVLSDYQEFDLDTVPGYPSIELNYKHEDLMKSSQINASFGSEHMILVQNGATFIVEYTNDQVYGLVADYDTIERI